METTTAETMRKEVAGRIDLRRKEVAGRIYLRPDPNPNPNFRHSLFRGKDEEFIRSIDPVTGQYEYFRSDRTRYKEDFEFIPESKRADYERVYDPLPFDSSKKQFKPPKAPENLERYENLERQSSPEWAPIDYFKYIEEQAALEAAEKPKLQKLLAVAEAGLQLPNPFDYGFTLENYPGIGLHHRLRQRFRELELYLRQKSQQNPYPPHWWRDTPCQCPICIDPDAEADPEGLLPKHHVAYLKDLEKNEVKNILKGDAEVAQVALDYYNDKYGVKYELKKTLGSQGYSEVGGWLHSNFIASREHDPDCQEPSLKLFFAELRVFNGFHCLTCCILEDEIVRGCRFCPQQLGHPVSGFEAGCRP